MVYCCASKQILCQRILKIPPIAQKTIGKLNFLRSSVYVHHKTPDYVTLITYICVVLLNSFMTVVLKNYFS